MRAHAIRSLEDAILSIQKALESQQQEKNELYERIDALKAINDAQAIQIRYLIKEIEDGKNAANKGSNRRKRSSESLQEARIRSKQKRNAAVAKKHSSAGRAGGVQTGSVDRSEKRGTDKPAESIRSSK